MSGGDAKYFQTTKKGEIRELQDDLNSNNKDKIKEAVKKVIAAMTVGKDVSMLFPDIIKSMGTDNIELKKLVYLYIINYARSQPEKAILIVNMFQKDATNHPNPLVRALAIRTMGCIRVDRITEYLCDPLNVALKDTDPYVRKTAAICVAKLYDINHELVEERGFIEILRSMLSDVNPMVVANAVASLTEISESSGTDYFKIDNLTLSKLLTALNECTEWGRVFILDALSKFECQKDKNGSYSNIQARDICDRVVPQLAHANSAVVMAAVKVVIKFLQYLSKKDEIDKFCKKLAPPLVTLLSCPPEIQYVALRNIDLIVQKYPKILQNDIRIFFVKFNDTVYVKMQKLEVLIKLTTRKNIDQVLMEFKEYCQEVDVEFVRLAVRAIGRIAIKLDVGAERCVHVLSDLVKTKVNYVVQESVIVIKDIFRRYPKKYEKIIVTLCDNLENLDEPEARASMIWIIGEYAERIIDAADRLEHFVESFQEENSMVQLQLLTATVKLFLKKPDKSKELVQKVLNLATENSDNPDLRDRGYVYWRLLSADPTAARAVVLTERPVISSETFSLPESFLNELLDNISTLASVYHRPPNEFIRGVNKVVFKSYNKDEKSDGDEDTEDSESESEHKSEESESSYDKPQKKEKPKPSKKNKPQVEKKEKPKPKPQPQQADDILDIFGDMGANPAAPEGNNTNSGNNNTNTGAGDLDLFNDMGFGDNSNNNEQKANALDMNNYPTFNQVYNQDNIIISTGYRFENDQTIVYFKFNNNTFANITKLDIKINKNYLGLQPTDPNIEIQNGSINSNGGLQIVKLPLVCNQQPVMKKPLELKTQFAIRCSKENDKPTVCMFVDDIQPHFFFNDPKLDYSNNNNAVQQFLNQWKNFNPDSNQQKQHQKIFNTDKQAIQNKLAQHNIVYVTGRDIPAKGFVQYYHLILRNVNISLELSVSSSAACRCICRSTNKYLSFVAVEAAIELIK